VRPGSFALATGLAVVTLVLAVMFLWPGPATGPEPIQYGRDTCASCRMQVTQPGFAGEMRDPSGTLTKYDDVGCLLRAILTAHREVPEAWIEDHAGGGFVPLLGAHLVRAEGSSTPMGYGIVAFADEAAARAYAAAHTGTVLAFEDVLRDPTMIAKRGAP
jgi:copper chaperone NosL